MVSMVYWHMKNRGQYAVYLTRAYEFGHSFSKDQYYRKDVPERQQLYPIFLLKRKKQQKIEKERTKRSDRQLGIQKTLTLQIVKLPGMLILGYQIRRRGIGGILISS